MALVEGILEESGDHGVVSHMGGAEDGVWGEHPLTIVGWLPVIEEAEECEGGQVAMLGCFGQTPVGTVSVSTDPAVEGFCDGVARAVVALGM